MSSLFRNTTVFLMLASMFQGVYLVYNTDASLIDNELREKTISTFNSFGEKIYFDFEGQVDNFANMIKENFFKPEPEKREESVEIEVDEEEEPHLDFERQEGDQEKVEIERRE